MPRVHHHRHQRREVRAATDVEVFREKGSEVHAARKAIAGDVDAELGDDEGGGGEEDGGAGAWAAGGLDRGEEDGEGPEGFAVALLGRGGDDDADYRLEGCGMSAQVKLEGGERGFGNTYCDVSVDCWADDLCEDGVSWCACETSVVVLIEDAGADAADAADYAVEDGPAGGVGLDEGLAGDGVAEAVRAHGGETPDEEGDLEDEDCRCRDVEEFGELVRSDPDDGEGDDAEYDVGHELRGCHACGGWHGVGYTILEAWPDGPQ